MSRPAVAGWLTVLLLFGSVAPAVAQAPVFDLVVDGGRVMDSRPLLAAAASTIAQGGSPIPFRLSPGGASIGVPMELGSERESSSAATPRTGYSLFLPSEDSSGSNPSGDQWRLAADGLTTLPEAPIEQPATPSSARSPDWPGIGRDTAFFFGYQVVSVAILYVLPGDINRWQSKDVSFDNWWDNVSRPPVWDSDPWGTNYLSHPYWGATYYIRARERGFGKSPRSGTPRCCRRCTSMGRRPSSSGRRRRI